MRYSVLKYRYLADQCYNLGDYIQSYAAIELLKKNGFPGAVICRHNRDELADVHVADAEIIVVQGWFGCKPGTAQLPVNRSFTPLYFGFHLNEGSWEYLSRSEHFVRAMQEAAPIGCRDYETRGFLRSLGVRAYYSGCLTLTIPRRQQAPAVGKVYCIDPLPGIEAHLPFNHTEIVHLSQVGSFPSGQSPATEEDCQRLETMARNRLRLLRDDATLVVTRRLHVALPALAMGIPTVFLFDDPGHPRIAMMADLLPIYQQRDFKAIDWVPPVVEVKKIKQQVELLFRYRLETLEAQLGFLERRLDTSEKILAEALLKTACQEGEVAPTNRFSRAAFVAGAFSREQLARYRAGSPLLLWGAGSAGKSLYDILRYFGFAVSAFADRAVERGNEKEYRGTAILAPEDLLQRYGSENALFYISAFSAYDVIREHLFSAGYAEHQIVGSATQIKTFAHFVVPTLAPLYTLKRDL